MDRMIEFRLNGPMNNRLPNVGKYTPGETVYLRVNQIACLFVNHYQVRLVDGYVLEVFAEDYPKVVQAFRHEFLGGKVHAMGTK